MAWGIVMLATVSCYNDIPELDRGAISRATIPPSTFTPFPPNTQIPSTPIEIFSEGRLLHKFDVLGKIEIDDEIRNEGGSIWVRLGYKSNYFAVIEVRTGIMREVQIPDGCSEMIPVERKFECINQDGELYLLDPFTEEVEITPINNAIWTSYSANGRYIAYENTGIEEGRNKLAVYDRELDSVRVLAETETELSSRGWVHNPLLSPDGKKLIVRIDVEDYGSRLFLIGANLSYTQISIFDLVVTDVSWSPVDERLVYAAKPIPDLEGLQYDYPSAIAGNLIHLIDYENSESPKFLSEEPADVKYTFFNSSLNWSPDGKYVVLNGREYICIIAMDHESQICTQLEETGYTIWTSFWSPSGRYLVYNSLIPRGGDPKLVILDTINNLRFLVIRNVQESLGVFYLDFIQWVK